ncbi:hypothetical protein UPYG_G00274230 [Umbra pygmaea]|uniref:F-box domain-containing protein n=1 Tax=Umbra pygmaea TaxID=75934 RepID=A0ABD0W6H7_UMBPY
MKLRVRINHQTSRVELEGEYPSVTELNIHIREILLPAHGFSPDTEFSMSLNGSEPLSDAGQTLSTCGVVPGDLVCVILPPSVKLTSTAPSTLQVPSHSSTSSSTSSGTSSSTSHGSASSSTSHNSTSSITYDAEWPAAQQPNQASSRWGVEPQQEVVRKKFQEEGPGHWVWEPMLCGEAEDGKVPHSLEQLFHQAEISSTCDALMVALHLLMLETGFLSKGSEVPSGEMPAGWRTPGGVHRLQYTHPLCEESLAMVLAVPMGAVLVVNATLKMNQQVETVRKLSLKPSAYVAEHWAGVSAAAIYRDLKKLSRVFKDQLVYPLIAAAREAMALPPVFGLPVLPPELLLRVLRLLDVPSLLALSSVNRQLSQVTADPMLWRHLFHRDFRDPQDHCTPRDTNWRELYKQKYSLRKAAGRCRVMPHPRGFQHPLYPLRPLHNNPLYPPGIIGGEHDLRPGTLPEYLPRPRFDPIGSLPGHEPTVGGLIGRRGLRPAGNWPSDIRRGFI